MKVSVIRNTEPKNANIFLVSAAGAATGLALRQFVPVTKAETDSVLFHATGKIRESNVNQARKAAFENILHLQRKDKNNLALELLAERLTASKKYSNALKNENKTAQREAVKLTKIAKEKIQTAPAQIRNEVLALTKNIINDIRATRYLTEGTIKQAVKHQRPVASFVLPGAALAALGGFVYNIVGAINRE